MDFDYFGITKYDFFMRLLLFIVLSLSFAIHFTVLAGTKNILIGYADGENFMPLLSVTAGSLKAVDAVPGVSFKKINEAFQPSQKSFQIKSWERAVDDISGASFILGKLDQKLNAPSRNTFYMACADHCAQLKVKNKTPEIMKSFYVYFSNDKWGKHFISPELSKKSLEEIALKSDIHIHYLTDLNENGLAELWFTYKLMHGEIGRMIYEQAGKSKDWKRLANRCVGCD
ncbi:hypothetical protein K2X05_01900 [bacterium]|nr:hypothetical protein [bacterium]